MSTSALILRPNGKFSGTVALNLTVEANGLQPAQPLWVMAAFNDLPEKLYFSASFDLHEWVPMSTFAQPSMGMRDPQLLYHRGRWYCSYTQGNTTRVNNQFGILVSEDLLDWKVLVTIDLTGHIANQEIWQPILAHDANGEVYCLCIGVGGAGIIYLRPTTPEDLSTLAFVSLVTMNPETPPAPLLVPNSAFLSGGVYYIEGPSGSPQTRKLYSATEPQGPYSWVADLDTVVDVDAVEMTVDGGNWYAFSNMLHQPGTPQWQVSEGGFTSFGNLNYGGLRRFLGGTPHAGENNPSCHRYLGAAAVSARLALDQVISTSTPTWCKKLPAGSLSFATANGGSGSRDTDLQVYGAPHVVSGNTSGGKATATIVHAIFPYAGAAALSGNEHKPIDLRCHLIMDPGASSSCKLLFGVLADHLGDLDEAGVGLRWASGQVELLVHDGSSQSVVASVEIPIGFVDVRVRIEGKMVVVWINGLEKFRFPNVPTTAASSLANTYRCIVLQADYSGVGRAAEAWWLEGELRYWEH